MIVPHSDLPVEGPQPMDVATAEPTNTADAQSVEDPPSAWFTWTVENFTRLNTKKLYSDVFYVGGYKWRVLIFPKGNNVDHLSMYLDIADSTALPYGWSRYAQFSLAVVNRMHSKFTLKKDTQHQFNAQESDWGFTSFMPLSELYDPTKGYLVNDSIIVEADVAVRKIVDYWSHDSKKETGYVGLKNQGATCYMNSLLQTLYHIPYFSAATDVKTSTEKQALPSNPFSAMSSPLAGTGSSFFGFIAGSTSSSAASQGSIFGTESMPVFGSSAMPSTLGTSGSTPFATSSTSSSPAFGNTTSKSFAFGRNDTSSSSLFTLSTSSNSPFGLSTALKDSGTIPSSTVFSFEAQSSQSPVFGSSTSLPVFSFSSAPQSQPMFGNTVVPAFGSGGNNGIAKDLGGPASTPSVPVFGQPLVSIPSPYAFMFGSTPPTSSSGVVPFQFGVQQSQPGQQNANLFQSSGSCLNLGGGGDGSFSLASGGGDDKPTRRIVRVKHRNRGKR